MSCSNVAAINLLVFSGAWILPIRACVYLSNSPSAITHYERMCYAQGALEPFDLLPRLRL